MPFYGINPGELPDFLIVGLGNPGQRFDGCRCNVGFELIDYLDSQSSLGRGCKRQLHHSMVDKVVLDNYVLYLIKPQTYIGNSGMAVRDIVRFYCMRMSRLIVIHEDTNLPVGRFKIVKGCKLCKHSGVTSIIDYIKQNNFIRIKIGVGRRTADCELPQHIRSKFSEKEYVKIKKLFPIIREAMACIYNYDVYKAMSIFNLPENQKVKTFQ